MITSNKKSLIAHNRSDLRDMLVEMRTIDETYVSESLKDFQDVFSRQGELTEDEISDLQKNILADAIATLAWRAGEKSVATVRRRAASDEDQAQLAIDIRETITLCDAQEVKSKGRSCGTLAW